MYCVHILKKPYLFQCFVFHLYKGVRAGGGIGDEIEPPDGDDYEVYRILFDITFFFFVIVILLAIIQGKKLNCMGNILASLQQSKSQFSYPIFYHYVILINFYVTANRACKTIPVQVWIDPRPPGG